MKERESIILGALLHDVGKVLNRVKGIREKHPVFSKRFVLAKEFETKVKNFVDTKILSTICQRHHEDERFFPEELLVQRIDDKHLRALAYIVSRADNYSSFEREEREKSGEYFRKTRLLSIFSKVDIGRGTKGDKYYELKPLSPENVYPLDKEIATKDEDAYGRLIKGSLTKDTKFAKSIKSLQCYNFNSLFNGLLSILEENLWCVPSDTRYEGQDISLFDHLSTTSAIASCLYDYHKDDLDEREIRKNEVEKFILIGGDLSGIQKFIFEISSTNPKKLSKVLRGRSFYLSLLTECASLKLLNVLNLPLSCKIMDAGGRFIILAPNKEETKEEIKNVVKEIKQWFLRNFLGKLSLNIDYSVTLSGNDFKSTKFNEKLKILNQRLEIKKFQKFNKEYFKLDNEKNDFKKAYNGLIEKGNCNFCGIYPPLTAEGRCSICENSQKIGEKLCSKNYLCFNLKDAGSSLLSILDIGIDFSDKVIDPTKYYLIEKIGDKEDKVNFGYIKKYVSNYIPEPQEGEICLKHEHKDKTKNRDCETLCKYCKDVCKFENDIHRREDEISRETISNSHLTFQCIATHSLKINNGLGVDHLAVLKADVDFLGMTFSLGLENPEKEEYLSISRFATLSRMLNYFFCACIKDLIKDKFNKIYTVYAGGDDMLLIGPWEQLLEFTIEMQNKFNEFVAENPNITISAGISLFRPHSQVKIATKIAEENLEKSKNSGKNRLTVFGTTVNWNEMNKLIEYKEFLNKEFRDKNSKINSAFLYRLLKYQRMFFEVEDEGKIEQLIYHSLMARDVRRNIEIRKDGQITNRNVIDRLYPLYAIGDSQDKELMRNLKIPIFWTIYKNRGGTK